MIRFRTSIALAAAASLLVAGTTWAAHPYVYPQKGQTEQQRQKDMYECHQWAVQQAGFDPSQPVEESIPHRSVLAGGARGAALGAVGGAIGGDAGKGAAIGAAAGGLASVMRNRQAVRTQQDVYNNGAQQYDRAYSTCLTGRGYSVG